MCDSLLKAIRLTSDVKDKRIFSNFLEVVDAVIAGEKEIPEVVNIHDVEGFDKHTHGEDE